jgi:hypothetical protein
MQIIKKKGTDHWYWQLPKLHEVDQGEQEAQDFQVTSAVEMAPVTESGPHEVEHAHHDVAT